jgi:hypothetical protein
MAQVTGASATSGVHPRDIVNKYLWWVIAFAVVIVIAFGIKHEVETKQKNQNVEPQTVAGPLLTLTCDTNHPCVLHEQNGLTVLVSVPGGKNVCFDDSFWENIELIGFRTSYRGSDEEPYTCTREQVISGVCQKRNYDKFRFVPKNGTSIPRYWFIDRSQSRC